MTGYDFISTPIGILKITANSIGISKIEFVEPVFLEQQNILKDIQSHIDVCKKQIIDFFNGKLTSFSVPLSIDGSAFQIKTWEQLREIPFGTTLSYKQLAIKTGNSNNSRAVGMANNKNRLPIIIPCHRVIGSDGNLVGYSGGLWRKEWLLNFEKQNTIP